MGRPKNSTISRGNNISRTVTHKCRGTPDDRTPEEVRKKTEMSQNTLKENVFGLMMMSQSKMLNKMSGASAATHHRLLFMSLQHDTFKRNSQLVSISR